MEVGHDHLVSKTELEREVWFRVKDDGRKCAVFIFLKEEETFSLILSVPSKHAMSLQNCQ